MNEIAAILVPALGTALLHFLWQGALLGLLAALGLTLLRNARPQARYAVACAALSASLLLPALTLAWLLSAPTGASVESLPVVVGANAGTANANGLQDVLAMQATTSLPWIVMLWVSGVATLLLRMAGGLWWVRRLQRQAWPEDGAHWQARADVLARKLGLPRNVRVRLFDGDAPLAIGWWRPMVLLPAALLARMPAGLLEALLAHELAHIRRHDYLVNLLQAVVEALLFYHPVVWWLSRRIRHERELIADDLAAEALGDRRSLALALSELDRMLGATAAGPIPRFAHAAHGGQLMSRIQHLLRPRQHPLAIGLSLPLLGLALAGVAMYAHAQSSAPDAASARIRHRPACATRTSGGARRTVQGGCSRPHEDPAASATGAACGYRSTERSAAATSARVSARQDGRHLLRRGFEWLCHRAQGRDRLPHERHHR